MNPKIIETPELRRDSPITPTPTADSFIAISGAAAAAIFALGLSVLAAWFFNIEAISILYFRPIEMKANAALAFVLAGISLWFLQTKRISIRTQFISRLCALVVASIGLLTLVEYVFNFNIGIDQALFIDRPDASTSNPGRMAPHTAVNFVLVGAALFLLDMRVHKRLSPSQMFAIIGGLISSIAFMGYVYDIALLYRISSHTAIALHASLAFILSSIGILFARPGAGIMAFLIKDSLGSLMARRLLLAVTVTPLLVDIVIISGQQAGFYGIAHTMAFHTIIVIFIIAGIVLHTSLTLNQTDDKRKKAEEELESVARFPGENPNPVIRINRELCVLYSNKASKPLFTPLGFHNDGDSCFAYETWGDLIVGALDSGQVNSVEILANDKILLFTIMPLKDKDYVNLYGYDITQIKSLEKALNYERNKLQNILDSMQDCVIITRCDLIIEYANPMAVRDFGPFENVKCYSYLYGLKERCSFCNGEKVFQEGKTIHREFTSDITGKTYDILEAPITNLDGSISRLGIFRDITARKQTEKDLRLFYQAIADSIDNIHIVDMSGKIIYVNNAATQMTGYSFAESIGMDVVNVAKDKDFAANVIMPAVISEGSWKGELLCEKKDGTPYYAWLAASLFNDIDGKPVAMMGSMRDITIQKEIETAYRTSEANLWALMNAIMESVCLIDKDGVFVMVNDTFAMRFDREKQEIVGKSFEYILEPEILESKKRHFNKVISTGRAAYFEHTRDGLHYFTNMYPVLNDNNEVSGIAMYTSDITTRKVYETQMISSLKEKEVLLQEIHHRVKNNLQIVSGLIGLQLNYVENETYRNMFIESQNRIKSISLVHDKLYRSKGVAEIDLNQYVLSLSNDLFGSFGVDKNRVTLTVDAENVLISIDQAIPCGLIINELFTNILKYAFPDKIIGEVNISVRTKDNDEVELIVADNGIGFPEGIDFRKTKSLGLHIVNILVKQLGGTIELDKTRGSRFCIKFKNQHSVVL
ncbi:MAG: PAS domain S-box protein [Nitrospirae bacterium]|nr:PAS domain S-box protein [Nitrospirota bacterium]